MRKMREKWLHYSLKKKIAIMMGLTLLITMVSEGVTMIFCSYTLDDFEHIINNNSEYHELQRVLKVEQETFMSYIRNNNDENKLALEEACEESAQCIMALPGDYEELGEERYGRTWNVKNGYEGYAAYRDSLLEKSKQDEDYVECLYQVLEMQENLSAYSLRLAQATMDQWNEVYQVKIQIFRLVPFFQTATLALLLLIIMEAWNFFAKTMIKPIMTIAEESRKIAANKLDTSEIFVENQDEIGELVTAFNRMKKAMVRHIYTLKEKNKIEKQLHQEEMEKMGLENSLEQAKFDLLKQQVNPHFLFNTLNMISSMARLEDAEITDKMTISLGNLFRYNLRTVEQEVFLEQEIQVLDYYIYLQQMRFDNRIVFEKEVLLDVSVARIPSFTLQPLVENAYVHGVSHMEADGRIVMRVWQEEDDVFLTIADNGKGMKKEALEELRKRMQEKSNSGRGIGLGNIYKRIHMMYPGKGKFEIDSVPGKGTVIQIRIPQKGNICEEGREDNV